MELYYPENAFSSSAVIRRRSGGFHSKQQGTCCGFFRPIIQIFVISVLFVVKYLKPAQNRARVSKQIAQAERFI
jgi:hypothetical protein